jgi:hypothetical protein
MEMNEMAEIDLSVLASQLGYRPEEPKRIVLRSDSLLDESEIGELRIIREEDGATVFSAAPSYWGAKWGIHFWTIDFDEVEEEGSYLLGATKHPTLSCRFAIRRHLLLEETLEATSVHQLDMKRGEKAGWQDCGSDLRALEGHAIQLIGLADAYEAFEAGFASSMRIRFEEHIRRGADYLVLCQCPDGSFLNEYYVDRKTANWSLSMLAVVALSRAYETVGRLGYLDAAKRGWGRLSSAEGYSPEELESEIDETRKIYGTYPPWLPPSGLRARDRLLAAWAGTELYKHTNDVSYKSEATRQAAEICLRLQDLGAPGSPEAPYGNFFAWEGRGMHQKSWEHVGWGYNCGSILPDELSGLVNLVKMFPQECDWPRWRYALVQYVRGYAKRTEGLSPFGIYPLGRFGDEIRFFGPAWHGFNGIYGRIAFGFMKLAQIFEDVDLERCAGRNMQWIAGLNIGKEVSPGRWAGVCWINGLGENRVESWTNIRGSISNGFCANPQFKMRHLDDLEDRPAKLTTEDWIVHNGCWLSGLSEVERPFRLKIRTQYRGEAVPSEVEIFVPECRLSRTNERGIAHVDDLPAMRRGYMVVRWRDSSVRLDLATVSGLEKTIIVDYAECIEASMSVDIGRRSCALRVANLGSEDAVLRLRLRALGIELKAPQSELRVGAGSEELFEWGFEFLEPASTAPVYACAEIAGEWSGAFCECSSPPR